jgi:hypothetical protein
MSFFPRVYRARVIGALIIGSVLSACSGGAGSGGAGGAGSSNSILPQSSSISTPTMADATAVKNAKVGRVQLMPTRPVGAHATAAEKAHAQSVVYPGDLQFFGGRTVQTARIYNVFVDSNEAAFSYPSGFEEHLSYSRMSHMLDEYVGATANNRYDWAGDIAISYTILGTLGDGDILTILHDAAVKEHATGYNHVFNIFLPKGVNYCGSGSLITLGACNASATSPNPAFCAFHGSVVYGDVGETLYNLEPYADTDYCGIENATANPTAPTPNGLQADSQYSQLSHELFETFTDPDVGQGWYDNNVGVNGEIGDLCAFIPQVTNLDGKRYMLQLEYSNKQHGCNNEAP